ncbi:hypothetical protein Bbelb_104160 [Branchiostoma belcheri]|nr:hypothetical protein Bbelb_104160 [Branchiostoma belcheri]
MKNQPFTTLRPEVLTSFTEHRRYGDSAEPERDAREEQLMTDRGYRSDVGLERLLHEFLVRLKTELERHASELAFRQRSQISQILMRNLDPVYVSPESLSNLVRRSVVPRGFESLPLTEQLKLYHSKRVELDEEETKHAKELVEIFIGAIVKSVKEQIDAGRPHGASRCRIEYTGSMYEGTKFGRPDEFDIMIVIDGSQDIESVEMSPGYAMLLANSSSSHRFSEQCIHPYQNISPKKMTDWFTGLVQKGINEVNIKENTDVSIDVDLVLCVQLSQQYFVAKPFADPDMLWRQSFSVVETRMIASIDGPNECRRDCLRILKSIFRAEQGLDKFTSFHLKTVLLQMCRDEEQWQSSRMGERFLDLLRRIEGCLRDEYLPHFYLPDLNLLDGIRSETIENMRGRVGNLINNTHERNRILHVLEYEMADILRDI